MMIIDENNCKIFGKKDVIKNKLPIVMTFGNFDGVHLGHKYVLEHLKKNSNHLPVVVVTFEPHPSTFFKPDNPKPLLTNLEDKVSLLQKYGADCVLVQKFTPEFSLLTADAFCQEWLKPNFNIQAIVLGHDSCYGKGRSGNFQHLKGYEKTYGWNVENLPPLETSEHEIISSSSIRQFLWDGAPEKAEAFLGRSYVLSGEVVKGDQMGRKIGFPTANLALDCNYVIPKHGVYACCVEIENNGNFLPSVMNCGVRPTVSGKRLQIEAHILNFSEDIYNKKLKFHLKKYLRSEMKFAHLDNLKEQIQLDVEIARNFFNEYAAPVE